MNDPRSAGRPGRTGTRTRSRQPEPRPLPTDPETRRRIEERRRRRRRAQQIRRMKMIVTACLILVILVSMGVGYLIGFRAGKASVESTQTLAPAGSEPPADPVGPEPPAQTEQTGDVTGPTIMGVNKMSVFLGSSIAYRSGILVSDDTDPAPKLSVDSFQVDLSSPGTYPVYYTATDSAGNTTTVETTITVVEAPETYVDEAIIKEKADELLAEIIKEDMTPEQKVNAVYDWVWSHCYYIAKFDKSDYMQAAYLMLTDYRGDCYGFYAVSRLLFDRLGLPNLTVTRAPNEVRTTNHWWNMVSLDGGETWYHFDSTPHLTEGARTCLVTDAYLEEFNQENPYYYYYDRNSTPRTPVE